MRAKTQAKFDYLSETKSLIRSAIEQKGQAVSDSDTFRSYADKILAISGGGGGGGTATDEIDIFPTQTEDTTVSGFMEDTGAFSGWYIKTLPESFEIKAGETYYVEWDGTTYTCKGISAKPQGYYYSYVYLGDGTSMGFEGNGEPFAILYIVGTGLVQVSAFTDSSPSHEIRIYQKAQSVIVTPLTVTENGTYTAPVGKAYSPVTVDVASTGGVSLPLGYELKEILSERTLTFARGNSELLPDTPAVTLATATEVADMEVINNGESGLVIWDGALYAVYAGQRSSPKIQFPYGTSTLTADGSVGNIGIPSGWMTGTVVEDTRQYGKSNEPFLIIANTSRGFIVAIPEDSTDFTHTLQIFKFIKQ